MPKDRDFPKVWIELQTPHIKALCDDFDPDSRKAVFLREDGADFDDRTKAAFEECGFERGYVGSAVAYAKVGSLKGDFRHKVFPGVKILRVNLESSAARDAIHTKEPFQTTPPKVEVDKSDVDWLVDDVLPSVDEPPVTDQVEVEASVDVEQASEVVVDAPVAETRPTVEQISEEFVLDEDMKAFEAFLIYEGVPSAIRREFIAGALEMNRVFSQDEIYSSEKTPSEFRKEFATRTPRKDLAKLKIADRVFPFLRVFREKSEADISEYLEFADRYIDQVEDFHSDFEREAAILQAKNVENGVNAKDTTQSFEYGTRISGFRTMVEFIVVDPQNQKDLEDEIRKDPRFAMLTKGQYINFKSPLLTMIKRDEEILERLKQSWEEKIPNDMAGDAPKM